MNNRKRRSRRKWCYVQRPKVYEIAGCPNCGNNDCDWSEWKHHCWCQKCKVDFMPAHHGIFDGPIPVAAAELLGVYFDRIDLKTNKLLPDWDGKSHFVRSDERLRGIEEADRRWNALLARLASETKGE